MSLLCSAKVRQGIVDMVQRALSDSEVKSVVICGQNGVFCGGKNNLSPCNITQMVQLSLSLSKFPSDGVGMHSHSRTLFYSSFLSFLVD